MASSVDARTSETHPSERSSGLLSTMRLGKYRIERQLGAGGMGTVFLAVDSELRRTVALKVLPKERAANPQLVRRFKSEGQSAARLEHNNIVKVFEAGEIDGHLYIALEYVDGIDVLELVGKRGTLPVRRSIEIVTQVAAALQHAYERGIVHRDIKPSNLLIRKDGVVKLADMGLARAIDETVESNITHAGMTVGTVDYISPEQGSDSKQADIRSDLYSLGCSWFHMLTGEVPYPEGTAIEKLRAHGTARIPDPRQINDRIPAAVVAVIQRLMSKRPENRYQTPQELIDDLRQPSLLHHEMGAGDLAGLALAASDFEADVVDRAETEQGQDIETRSGPGSARRSRKGSAGPRPAARPQPLSDSVEVFADEPAPTDNRRPDPRRGAAKRAHEKPQERPGKRKPEGKVGRAATAKESVVKRELPPRSERPEKFAVSQGMIDPGTIKVVGFGLLALVVVSAIGWMIWRGSQNQGPDLTPAGANPFAARGDPPPAPPPVVDSAPEEKPVAPPSAEVTNFRPPDPFPGIGEAPDTSGVADVPRWVYEVREHARPNPRTIVVDLASTEFRTAADALSALPPEGGIIEFHGRGPFLFGAIELNAGQDVLFRASAGDQPVLHLADAGSQINVRSGRLEIDGLHLVASGRGRTAASPLINLESSTALIRNSSITLADPVDAAVPAVRLTGSPGPSSRCVLENVVVRGNNVTAALLSGPGHELIVGNCLLASGDAPAVAIHETAAARVAGSLETSVQLLATDVMSRNAVLAGAQREVSATPHVRFRLRQSNLMGDGPTAVALRLDPWPQAASADLDQPRALGFQLVPELAKWTGWTGLTEFRPAAGADPVLVTTEAEALQFWRIPLENVNVDAASPSQSSRRDYQQVGRQPEGNDPILGPTARSLIARLVADSARPRVPENLDAPFTGPVVTFDLAKNGLKLSRLLNGPECPDGARVVLTGRKKALVEPVVLQGKSLRIEFDGGDEALTIEPVTRSGVERPQALFRVEQGRLDLVNVRIRIPPSETSSYPLRVLQVVDASFAVRNCIVIGQIGAGAQDEPVIEWRPGRDAGQFGLIDDSLISAQSQAVAAHLQGQLLEVRNSVLASEGSCCVLSAAPAEASSALHVERGFLSAAKAFFQFAAPADGAQAGALGVFVDRSVYGPPLVESAEPVLVFDPGQPVQYAPARVDWWESRTAISDRIRWKPAETTAQTGPVRINDNWLDGWGRDHVVDSVYGPLGVILAAKQVEIAKAQPADFQLDAKSAAATASSDGGALGPDTNVIGPRFAAASEPAKTANPAQKTPTEPRKGNRVNF